MLKSRRGNHAGHFTRANLAGTNADENTSALFVLQSVRLATSLAKPEMLHGVRGGHSTSRASGYFHVTIVKSKKLALMAVELRRASSGFAHIE